MRLLMSLCNVDHFNAQFSLAVVEPGGRPPRLVDCGDFVDVHGDVGIAGLCPIPGGLAVAVQSMHPKVVLLDEQWRVTKVIADDRFADLHSLHFHDGFLFCLCSATNKVMKVSLADHAVSLFWEYQIDTPFLHINAMIFHQGRPLVVSHKIPPEAPERTESGGAWYLDDYSVLIPNLHQPHTLMEEGGCIYCLSSHDSRVVTWRDGTLSEEVVPSYLRGMAFVGDRTVLGSSSQRFISRKQQDAQPYTDFSDVIGNSQYMSSLVIGDRDFHEQARIDTTHLAFEIYDIIEDPGVPEALLVEDSAAVRLQAMQRQIIALRERLQTVRVELAE
jgi:hypothetical protein